jgi:hypothetical protein
MGAASAPVLQAMQEPGAASLEIVRDSSGTMDTVEHLRT